MKTIKNNNGKWYINRILVFCFLLLGFTSLYAQNNKKDSAGTITIVDYIPIPPPSDSIRVFAGIDTMPKFPGNATKYIADSIRYPEEAKEKKIQGTVLIDAIVEKDGSISHLKAIRSPDTVLNQEAIRVISTMPKWTPGQHNGKPVRVHLLIPVRFLLEPEKGTTNKWKMPHSPKADSTMKK